MFIGRFFACILISISAVLLTFSANGFAEDAATEQLPVRKILFLGNSITLHGPLESIGWSGNWGMAASAAERDYVHLLTTKIQSEWKCRPETMVRNIADFERQYATYDIQQELKEALSFQADLIVVAIGENVSALQTEDAISRYEESVRNLLMALRKDRTTPPPIYLRSTFWTDPVKDQAMARACEATGTAYVDLQRLDADEKNFARSERVIAHAGVAGHPGDKGMQAIADRLWNAISKK
ncbi:MAG: SGNH/GDSL hydrolase family protein [Planctomyces sp.]|jgi:hypothetical protein